MEGPSLVLAAEQLKPFTGHIVKSVEGNTKIGKERLLYKEIVSIFSYGKYLFFQFDTFALRVHFLLWGSFQATINDVKVTGDYPKKARVPRLLMEFDIGQIIMYSCSIRYIENPRAIDQCDFTIDIMSKKWKSGQAFAKLKKAKKREIGDALLDQSIFMGIGNIIKNEVLIRTHTLPTDTIENLSDYKLKNIIREAHKYVFEFYKWRKKFELKKHYLIYRQSVCKVCGSKVERKKTGERKRLSFICRNCQK